MGDRRAVLEGCRYDPRRVDRVVGFLEKFCRHTKGQWAGQPLTPMGWQREGILEPVFGWIRPDGFRRVRRSFVEIPKKNGKSSFAAGLALYMLVADGEPGPEVYAVAYGRQQARIVFDDLVRMVRGAPALSRILRPYPTVNRITYDKANGFALALSRDANLQEGLSASAIIFDELHTQKSRDLWDSIEDAGAARRQPLLLSITTAGSDRASICYEQHLYARAILEGSNDDPTFHGLIYAADEEDDWQDPKTWRAANPSYGVTISPEEIAAAAEKAATSPAAEMTFRRRRLNQWVASAARWIDYSRWVDCADDDFDETALEGRACYVGLDLASTQDLTAACFLFPDEEGPGFSAFWRYWIPEAAARDRERTNRGRFLAWAQAGALEMTPGEVTDYERIRVELVEMSRRFRILEVAFDPWNATHLSNQLAEEGLQMVEFRQTYRDLSEPVSRLAADVASGILRHCGDPVTGFCVGNAVLEINALGDQRLSRKASADKIDGCLALAFARGRSLVAGAKEPGSVYETRGLREV